MVHSSVPIVLIRLRCTLHHAANATGTTDSVRTMNSFGAFHTSLAILGKAATTFVSTFFSRAAMFSLAKSATTRKSAAVAAVQQIINPLHLSEITVATTLALNDRFVTLRALVTIRTRR